MRFEIIQGQPNIFSFEITHFLLGWSGLDGLIGPVGLVHNPTLNHFDVDHVKKKIGKSRISNEACLVHQELKFLNTF